MLKKWKKLSSEVVHKNPWWEYRLDKFKLPNGKQGEYHYMSTPGSVFIVPVAKQGTILLHKQYRFLVDQMSVEFPAGGIKEGQTSLEAAQAELAEELQVKAAHWQSVGFFYPGNGLLDEKAEVFLAYELEDQQAKADETESFEIFKLSFEEVERMIEKNEIKDAPSIAAWAIAKPHILKIIQDQL